MEDKQNIVEIKLSKKGKAFLKTFTRFLKERQSFAPFQRAFFQENGYRINNILKEQCEYCDNGIIDHSFTWQYTQEGHEYWKSLQIKFFNLTRIKDFSSIAKTMKCD